MLIPNSSRSGGISRRISGEERDQIKDALNKLNIPENMSAIVRTNGLGRTAEELSLDLAYLLALWDEINNTLPNAVSPSLIFRDDKLIVRVVRDYFKEDIEEILIDDKDIFDEAKEFIDAVIPDHSEKVKYYNEEIPLFNRYQIESQIEVAFQREISLNSGGSIVIDPTEAMTAIDVNSARSTKGKDIEETAFKTNLEAAVEIARQLKLRDVGGLVVIDFIDMLKEENQTKVESAFRKAVYSDRARVQISNISRFGLLEISRQRLRPSLNESYDIEHVLVRGPRSLGQSILRIVGEDAAKDNTGEIHVFVPADVASYLLNEKRYDIISIEKTNNIKILVVADPYKSRPYYKVIRIKSSDVKVTDSYNLTPDSPEPDVNWRDVNNKTNNKKPLVNGVKPPKMPKKKKDGIVKWLKSITGIDSEETIKTPKKPQRRYKKNKNYNKGKNKPAGTSNKKFPNKKNVNQQNNVKNQNSIKSKPHNKNDANKKDLKKVSPKKDIQKKKDDSLTKTTPVKKDISLKKESTQNKKAPKKKEPAIKEIVREKKIKKDIPLRAKNDPRQKS